MEGEPRWETLPGSSSKSGAGSPTKTTPGGARFRRVLMAEPSEKFVVSDSKEERQRYVNPCVLWACQCFPDTGIQTREGETRGARKCEHERAPGDRDIRLRRRGRVKVSVS